MEIGLLLCDHFKPELAEIVGELTDLFSATFEPAGMQLRIYDATRGDLPASPSECRGWITSGSQVSAYDDLDWIAPLGEFIQEAAEAQVPHFGVCFGHQLIAQSLGGEVTKAEVGWGAGAKTFEVIERAPWMKPNADAFTLIMSHQDQVTRLPPGATVIAQADYCPVASYRIGDHVFCVQGHPEFTPELSRFLTQKRREKLGEAVANEALASLSKPLDAARVVDWVARFFGVTDIRP